MLVRVTLPDGTDGWGECAALERPTYSSETTDGAWALLRDELVPAVLAGREAAIVGPPDGDRRAGRRAASTPSCGCRGAPLAGALGATRTSVAATRVLGIGPSVDDLLARVDAAPAGVKLKIAPGWDLEPLRAVRAAFPDRWLAADANGGYGVDDLADLAAVDELGPRLPRAAPARV